LRSLKNRHDNREGHRGVLKFTISTHAPPTVCPHTPSAHVDTTERSPAFLRSKYVTRHTKPDLNVHSINCIMLNASEFPSRLPSTFQLVRYYATHILLFSLPPEVIFDATAPHMVIRAPTHPKGSMIRPMTASHHLSPPPPPSLPFQGIPHQLEHPHRAAFLLLT